MSPNILSGRRLINMITPEDGICDICAYYGKVYYIKEDDDLLCKMCILEGSDNKMPNLNHINPNSKIQERKEKQNAFIANAKKEQALQVK